MDILGVDIDALTSSDIMTQIKGSKHPLFIASINPEILLYASHHQDYQDILNQASLKFIDGIGVVIMARLLYGAKLMRFAGVELAQAIIADAGKTRKKVFLLGGTIQANQQAITFLLSNFQFSDSSLIKGFGGNFTREEAIKCILDYNPDVLFVALGAPKQEQFIHSLLTRYPQQKLPSILMGIGGAIDFWARPKLRAPNRLRSVGLEWLWRLFCQPWRLKRVINATILFPVTCLRQHILLR